MHVGIVRNWKCVFLLLVDVLCSGFRGFRGNPNTNGNPLSISSQFAKRKETLDGIFCLTKFTVFIFIVQSIRLDSFRCCYGLNCFIPFELLYVISLSFPFNFYSICTHSVDLYWFYVILFMSKSNIIVTIKVHKSNWIFFLSFYFPIFWSFYPIAWSSFDFGVKIKNKWSSLIFFM